jgi:hypothetical protein
LSIPSRFKIILPSAQTLEGMPQIVDDLPRIVEPMQQSVRTMRVAGD